MDTYLRVRTSKYLDSFILLLNGKSCKISEMSALNWGIVCLLSCERAVIQLDLKEELYLLWKTILKLQIVKKCSELWLLTNSKRMFNAAHVAFRTQVYKLGTWEKKNVFKVLIQLDIYRIFCRSCYNWFSSLAGSFNSVF